MNYIGSRNHGIKATASQAILKGICEDGGLYVPEEIPEIHKSLDEISQLSYNELAYEVLRLYLSDFTEEELKKCIESAYDEKFSHKLIAPVVKKDDVYFLELFHGRTAAFKDMALSILPYLMKIAAEKNGIDKEIVILAATSGDTGKAALEGFADVCGTSIIVFFPQEGVSPVQKLQMVTQTGKNTCAVGIKGNFDDAQRAVKTIFTDKELIAELQNGGYILSSANSINIGRLVPQIVYYFYAYGQLMVSGDIKAGDKINFCVPTGNFGNILAGYYAKCMGLPINKLICASNDNKVLYDFFGTGVYNKNRDFYVTISPSMDILVSSNLERLINKLTSPEETKRIMENLDNSGEYKLTTGIDEIVGEFTTDKETFEAIKGLYEKTGYVIDTHTAVAYGSYKKYLRETGDETKTVIVSTASPYKFAGDVLNAIDSKYENTMDTELMDILEGISGAPIPGPLKDIHSKKILHNDVCEKNEIKGFIRERFLSK